MQRFLTALAAAGALLVIAPAAHAAPPPNDDLAQAAALGAPPASVQGTVAEATRQSGEPKHAKAPTIGSVWYRFTPTADAAISLDTCTADFDTVLAVYTGTAVGALTEVTSNDDTCELGSRVTFSAEAGTTYRVAVAAFSGDGPFQGGTRFTLRLRVPTAPRNDAFADAQRLTRTGRVTGTNVRATRELGEPVHPFTGGSATTGQSIWYRYRATRTQTLTADTVGSDFDTTLAVYRGDLGSLRRITSNDDQPPYGLASLVRFRVERGRTYFFAVDGFVNNPEGNVQFGISDGGARGVGLRLDVQPAQTLSTVRTGGLRTNLRCVLRCSVRVEARVGQATARRLGLGRSATTVARLEGRLGGDDRQLVGRLRLSREARSAFAGEDSITLTVRATVLRTGSSNRTVTRTVRLVGSAQG